MTRDVDPFWLIVILLFFVAVFLYGHPQLLEQAWTFLESL